MTSTAGMLWFYEKRPEVLFRIPQPNSNGTLVIIYCKKCTETFEIYFYGTFN